MLEKIVNISAGSDYKQSSKPGNYSKVARYIAEYHSTGNDSISLSPATGFLAILGWKLKKISSDKETIHIEFSLDDIDFSTTLNPNEIQLSHRFEYIIKFLLGNYAGSPELIVKISALFNPGSPENNYIKSHLPEIKNFFDAVYSACGHKSTVSADLIEVQKIFSESENGLIVEFNYLNKNLVAFLEKFLSIKINLRTDRDRNGRLSLNSCQIRKI
jgi:hypothetical protein